MINQAAPLKPVFVALSKFSQAYLPSASLVLAGSLVAGSRAAKEAKEEGGGDSAVAVAAAAGSSEGGDGDGFKRFIATVCVARFVLMPLLAVALLRALSAARVLPSATAAPALWFFLLTEFSMPPAQNSVVMFQVRRSFRPSVSLSV